MASSPHAAAQLVELANTKSVGIKNHHHRGVRNIDAHLDDGRGHEDINLTGGKGLHDLVFLRRGKSAVDGLDPAPGEFWQRPDHRQGVHHAGHWPSRFFGFEFGVFFEGLGLNGRCDNEPLSARGHFFT